MTQKRYAIAHQAKFGKPGEVALTTEMMEAINVMSQASCRSHHLALYSFDAASWKGEGKRTYAIDIVASAKGSPTICPRIIQYVLCFPFNAACYQS